MWCMDGIWRQIVCSGFLYLMLSEQGRVGEQTFLIIPNDTTMAASRIKERVRWNVVEHRFRHHFFTLVSISTSKVCILNENSSNFFFVHHPEENYVCMMGTILNFSYFYAVIFIWNVFAHDVCTLYKDIAYTRDCARAQVKQ